MQKRSSRDINVRATDIVSKVTDEAHIVKNTALGRLGGLKGGRVRAERLTRARRVEIVRKAAVVRWGKGGYNRLAKAQAAKFPNCTLMPC